MVHVNKTPSAKDNLHNAPKFSSPPSGQTREKGHSAEVSERNPTDFLDDFSHLKIASSNDQAISTDYHQNTIPLFTNHTCLITPPPTRLKIGSLQASPLRTSSMPLLTPPDDLEMWKWDLSPSPGKYLGCGIPEFITMGSSGPTTASSAALSMAKSETGYGGPPKRCTSNEEKISRRGTSAEPTELFVDDNGTQLSLAEFVRAAVVVPTDAASNTLQIISQTLPSPSKGDSMPEALFLHVIAAVQSQLNISSQPYITITHAVPPRFDLLNLPSSPPSTPMVSATGEEDYFTQSIFAHAAIVPAHHVSESTDTPTPILPTPIVPPSSVHISALERYIPPSSEQEGRELCDLLGHSPLVDRLTELSARDGTMLFVYPTKTGGETFLHKYIDPILGRLLRSLVTMHQLSYDLARSLNIMSAIAHMAEFSQLKSNVSVLCDQMSDKVTFHDRPSRYRLVHACKGKVALGRRTWTDWYLNQEHGRFKRTLNDYWSRGKLLSQVESATSGSVLREFIDGVKHMTPGEAEHVGAGIEVGVFAIRRTLTI